MQKESLITDNEWELRGDQDTLVQGETLGILWEEFLESIKQQNYELTIGH